ncbi:MAG: HAD family phosphatase [Flavobacteriaceae bacterium]|nr:HAD family phosphatase [Flavobacteriaceae bacterium]
MNKINTIVFDLGGVLIDWNPKYLYRKVFDTETRIDWFLNNICTSEWNVQQDAGRSFSEATQLLVNQYPEYEKEIRFFYDRWTEMLGGAIQDTVSLLHRLKAANSHALYALTNWSDEAFPVARERFDFLQLFEGIVVSGEEKTRKPFRDIYEILIERYGLTPQKSVFIDDNLENVLGAIAVGMQGIHFKNSRQLINELNHLGVRI